MELRRGRPGGEQLGQSRMSDSARGRRRRLPRTLPMVPAQRIPCKAPKAKLFMKRRDFLLVFRGRTRQCDIRDRQWHVQGHPLASALDRHLVDFHPFAAGQVTGGGSRGVGHQKRDAIGAGRAFDARGQVHAVAHGRVAAAQRRAETPTQTTPVARPMQGDSGGRPRSASSGARAAAPAPSAGRSRRDPGTGLADQFWTNCICVPARSMMSPCLSEMESSPTGWPLTLGRREPSTCDST